MHNVLDSIFAKNNDRHNILDVEMLTEIKNLNFSDFLIITLI